MDIIWIHSKWSVRNAWWSGVSSFETSLNPHISSAPTSETKNVTRICLRRLMKLTMTICLSKKKSKMTRKGAWIWQVKKKMEVSSKIRKSYLHKLTRRKQSLRIIKWVVLMPKLWALSCYSWQSLCAAVTTSVKSLTAASTPCCRLRHGKYMSSARATMPAWWTYIALLRKKMRILVRSSL